jgi:1-acyl-sn-glycerol-3-phosphate acyltransferase
MSKYTLRYPRRIVLRFCLRMLGRLLMFLLARPQVNGLENLPKKGPVILVGNHVAIMEVIMMAIYAPWSVEFIGTGDIPVDPRFAWMVRLYGYIPVNRGSVDRNEMKMPMDVLKQNGAVGIFPEGGIWSTSMKRARTGVAWLSYHTQAPVVPMGFGGMRGAFQALFQLKRPRLVMNVGHMMPAVDAKVPGKSRKQALEDAANAIMAQVESLIPPDEKRDWNHIQNEQFDFQFVVHTPDAETAHSVAHPRGLGRFFHTPVILDVMARNMELPVQPLQHVDTMHDAEAIAQATEVALSFLDSHPQFLNYRFGYAEAAEMYAGVVELHELACLAAEKGQQITLKPVRRYYDSRRQADIEEIVPGVMHEM